MCRMLKENTLYREWALEKLTREEYKLCDHDNELVLPLHYRETSLCIEWCEPNTQEVFHE